MYIRNLAFGTGTPIAGMASAMATCLGLIIGTVSIIQITALRNQDA
jgi:multiple sugar transport system permease protein